jgi:hypothetical protein
MAGKTKKFTRSPFEKSTLPNRKSPRRAKNRGKIAISAQSEAKRSKGPLAVKKILREMT